MPVLSKLRLVREVVRRTARLGDRIADLQRALEDSDRRAQEAQAHLDHRVTELRDAVGHLHARQDEIATQAEDRSLWWEPLPPTPSWDPSVRPLPRLGVIEEVRDSVHLITRRLEPHRRARVLFLVHSAQLWEGQAAVVAALQDTDDFEPLVLTVPHHFNGDAGPTGEDVVSQHLSDLGVPHLRLPVVDSATVLTLKQLEPDLIFRQSQWDGDVPAPLAVRHLTFARLCVLPYETANIVENFPTPDGRDPGLDSELHRAAWAVFCTNDLMRARLLARSALRPERVHTVGHPKIDRLRSATPAWPLPERPGARRVVLSFHHTIATGWTDFGVLTPDVCAELLAWAREEPEHDFVLSPHPALFAATRLELSRLPEAAFEAWLQEWEALPNTAVVTGGYPAVLAASDVLVSDGLSLLIEYQVFGRPVVFMERPDHRPFNEVGRIVEQGMHPVVTVAEARAAVTTLLTDGDPLAGRQREIVAELFGVDGRSSADRVVDVLRSRLAAERESVLVDDAG